MKLDALDHPKVLDFAAQLGVSRPTAIGHLELLWAFTGQKAPQGNVGKWPDGAIARACDWMGDPKVFLGALCSSHLLDEDKSHRYVIHDWEEHAPRWVRGKLGTMKLGFLAPTGHPAGGTSSSSVNGVNGDTVDGTVLSAGKGSEGLTQNGSHEPSASKLLEGAGAKPKRPKRHPLKSSIPDGFTLDAELAAYATAKIPDADPTAMFESFCGAARAKGWQYVDWRQAWQTYVRNCAPNSGHWASGQYPKAGSGATRWM